MTTPQVSRYAWERDLTAPKTRSGEPRVYTSAEASQLARISLRQLQWLDEREIVSPRQDGHKRLYTHAEIGLVVVIGRLRRAGMTLQQVRGVMRKLRAVIEERTVGKEEGSRCVVTDGRLLIGCPLAQVGRVMLNMQRGRLRVWVAELGIGEGGR